MVNTVLIAVAATACVALAVTVIVFLAFFLYKRQKRSKKLQHNTNPFPILNVPMPLARLNRELSFGDKPEDKCDIYVVRKESQDIPNFEEILHTNLKTRVTSGPPPQMSPPPPPPLHLRYLENKRCVILYTVRAPEGGCINYEEDAPIVQDLISQHPNHQVIYTIFCTDKIVPATIGVTEHAQQCGGDDTTTSEMIPVVKMVSPDESDAAKRANAMPNVMTMSVVICDNNVEWLPDDTARKYLVALIRKKQVMQSQSYILPPPCNLEANSEIHTTTNNNNYQQQEV
eukprot:gene2455-2791_t